MSPGDLPAGVRWLLRRVQPGSWADSVEGDLQEEWARSGTGRLWIWGRALGIVRAELGERQREARSRLPGMSRGALGRALRTRGGRLMTDLIRDLRYGLRSLRRSPGFAATAIATLAVGIAATAALYSFTDAFLFRPLPFREPDRLVHLWGTDRVQADSELRVSWPTARDWEERSRSFSGIALFNYTEETLTGEKPVALPIALVSADVFDVLGVAPLIGRGFLPGEDRPGAPRVAVLSHAFWQSRFAGDEGVLGQSIELERRPHTVVGVMPPGFAFPLNTTTLFIPYELDPARYERSTRSFQVVARLAPGVSPERAQEELDTIAAELEREYPAQEQGRGVRVGSLRAALNFADPILRPMSALLGAAVAFLLLLTCANVASLQLGRAVVRVREMAIRVSLGAGRQRVLRQMLTESALLAALAGAVGLALAQLSLRGIDAVIPPDIYRVGRIGLDASAFLATLGVCLATALAFGLAPALRAIRIDPQVGLREGALTSGGGRSGHRLLGALTALQVGVAATLLVGSVLLLRSLSGLGQVDPGFRPEGVLSVRLILPGARYGSDERVVTFQRRVLEEAASVPGVEAAAIVNYLPLNYEMDLRELDDGRGGAVDGPRPRASQLSVTPAYFETLGIDLLQGRSFLESDDAGSAPVAIVNRSLAERMFPGESPLGARLRVRGSEDWTELSVVGVVADTRHWSLQGTELQVYRPQFQAPWLYGRLLTRGAGPATARTREVRGAVARVDPDLPEGEARSLTQVVEESLLPQRGLSVMMGLLALGALLLSSVGIHGVLGQLVAQRTREIGIRMAVGATGREVRALVLRRGLLLAGFGVAGGLALALVAARLLEGFLYGVSGADPISFVGTALFLLTVAWLAASLPARRAARVDPLVALRCD